MKEIFIEDFYEKNEKYYTYSNINKKKFKIDILSLKKDAIKQIDGLDFLNETNSYCVGCYFDYNYNYNSSDCEKCLFRFKNDYCFNPEEDFSKLNTSFFINEDFYKILKLFNKIINLPINPKILKEN